MKIEKISINGRIVEPGSASLSSVDHGFMYGLGAFETFRVREGKVFLLEKHFTRLEKSLKALNIKVENNRSKYYDWVRELTRNIPKEYDSYIRFMVTAGDGALGISQDKFLNSRTIIYLGYISPLAETAKRAIILKSITRTQPEYLAKTSFRIKSPDYVSARIAQAELEEWEARPGNKEKATPLDGIMLTPEGYASEALTSNIFWVKNGELFTPPLETGVLVGTIRTYLLETNTVHEKLADSDELLEADEIFLTSGVSYINPLEEIDGLKKPGVSGPVFKDLFTRLKQDMTKSEIL